jgi:hypothetical protein
MTYVSPPLVPAKRQRSKEVGDTDAKRGIPFATAKTIRVLVYYVHRFAEIPLPSGLRE